MGLFDFNSEYEYKRSSYPPKNQLAYDDWHEWVASLSNYEKGLYDIDTKSMKDCKLRSSNGPLIGFPAKGINENL